MFPGQSSSLDVSEGATWMQRCPHTQVWQLDSWCHPVRTDASLSGIRHFGNPLAWCISFSLNYMCVMIWDTHICGQTQHNTTIFRLNANNRIPSPDSTCLCSHIFLAFSHAMLTIVVFCMPYGHVSLVQYRSRWWSHVHHADALSTKTTNPNLKTAKPSPRYRLYVKTRGNQRAQRTQWPGSTGRGRPTDGMALATDASARVSPLLIGRRSLNWLVTHRAVSGGLQAGFISRRRSA